MKRKNFALLAFISIFIFSGCTQGGITIDDVAEWQNLRNQYAAGSENAPVLIEEYADYQCPACRMLHTTLLPEIKKNLIDTGKVRYVFRDFPLPIHSEAVIAAESTYCAGEQDKYQEMQDIVFMNQGNLLLDDLKQYAKDIGLDSEAFDACMDEERYQGYVEASRQEGIDRGVRATPTMYINDTKVEGIPSFQELEQMINAVEAE